MNCNNVEEYVDFLVKNEITQEQLLFLRIVYFNSRKAIIQYKDNFPSLDGSMTMLGKSAFDDLFDKGFLRYDDQIIDRYVITEKFLDRFVSKRDQFMELLKVYPKSFTSNTGEKIIMSLSKKPEIDFQKAMKVYHNNIGHSRDEHNEVMKDLLFAIDKDLLRGRLYDWWIDQYGWLAVREIRLESGQENKIPQNEPRPNLF